MTAETTFHIDGMTCNGCVRSVDRALQTLDGIEATDVQIGQAIVRYDTLRTTPEALAAAIEDAGFEVTDQV